MIVVFVCDFFPASEPLRVGGINHKNTAQPHKQYARELGGGKMDPKSTGKPDLTQPTLFIIHRALLRFSGATKNRHKTSHIL